MTYLAKPKLHHPTLPSNKLGFTRRDYEGKISTLCAGCGHDSISAALVQACWELDIEPHRVAKLSGIGCSSKTPDYFLGQSHGFNTVHGRMPSVLTGANLANRSLLVNELEIDPKKLVKVLHFDGTPITARFIVAAIAEHVRACQVVVPLGTQGQAA